MHGTLVNAVRVALLVLVLVAPVLPWQAQTATADSARVVVMTRNLYLGADLAPVFAAPLDKLPGIAAQQFKMVQATDFPARARVLAKEIKLAKPDVIGL